MFQALGQFVERRWSVILLGWLALTVCAMGILHGWINQLEILPWKVPTWREVAKDGEFAYLPPNMQSLVGEELVARAFPRDLLTSSVVIVVRRESHPLVDRDTEFIDKVLRPKLEAIRAEYPDMVSGIKTYRDPLMGRLLVSEDQKASLVILAMTTEFLEWRNRPVIEEIENLLYRDLVAEKEIPMGLDLAMSGTASVGRDMLVASSESAKATELWTTILVVLLLVVIYRSPVLAIIPLLTVFTAVQISLALVTLLTQVPFLNYKVFMGMEVYITVVVYGTGVDYCLFLIARYKEELDSDLDWRNALSATLSKVGAALVASAGTVICGIGMMVFAQFGKFRQAGIGISLSLCVGLLAALTLAPALLRLANRWAFWPYGRLERAPVGGGWITGTSLINRLMQRNYFELAWERVGRLLIQKPGQVLLTCLAIMAPFAFVGLYWHDYLSYGLLSELPAAKQSVIGAKAVQAHFPAGSAGPITILLQNDRVDFREQTGLDALDQLVQRLYARHEELGIADVRYVSQPIGLKAPSNRETGPSDGASQSAISRLAQRTRKARLELEHQQAEAYYISSIGDLAGHVTRIDVVFEDDPFTRESIEQLNTLEGLIRQELPDSMKEGTRALFVGPTASIRDLKTVTDQDQVKIDVLVLISVFLILVVLLGKPAISLYLIVSVFFSYFVTLGVTFAFYWWLDPANFSGLDWKVPMFLFTILIAIGEDYNIFLMTRIEEEQLRHGPVEGVRVALLRTGTIISSCGVIMAGTFLSLLAGTLVGMQQLGFALAFGVLLDTFVVRPILVPAYLILLHRGAFGAFGRFLGETRHQPEKIPESTPVSVDL